MEKVTYNLDTVDHVIKILIKKMQTYKVFAFHGDMGTGKTTLISILLEHAQINQLVTSPTFAYVNTYFSNKYKTNIHHFDLYRLTTIDELYALALDDLLYDQKAFIFIEWPDLVLPMLKKNHAICELFLDYDQTMQKRVITIKEPVN